MAKTTRHILWVRPCLCRIASSRRRFCSKDFKAWSTTRSSCHLRPGHGFTGRPQKGLFTTSKFPYSHATDIPESNLSGCCQHVKYSCSHCRLQTPSSSLSNNSSNTLPIIWVNFAPKQTSVFRKLVLKQETCSDPFQNNILKHKGPP